MIEIVFQPEDVAMSFPFQVNEDNITEGVEYFPLFLLMDEIQPGLQLSAISDAMVNIQDNDGNFVYPTINASQNQPLADINECDDPKLSV